MEEFPKYYFITVFNSYDYRGIYNAHCCGFYDSWYIADSVISNNITNLWENTYHYGVLEEYVEGIGGCTGVRYFYKYNMKTGFYENINEPEELKGFIGFAFG
jgi:hypothetical protein